MFVRLYMIQNRKKQKELQYMKHHSGNTKASQSLEGRRKDTWTFELTSFNWFESFNKDINIMETTLMKLSLFTPLTLCSNLN